MPSPFEEELRAFDREELQAPGPSGATVFYGSSSIRLWATLRQDFRRFTVINRGYGGSTLYDCAEQFDRVVVPLLPRVIVFYASDNDLDEGRSPESVLDSFRALLARKRRLLPEVPLAFLSIKPAPVRWHNRANVRRANALVEALIRAERAGSSRDVHYLDLFTPMMAGPDAPRRDLFIEDGLHLNHWGYRLWTGLVTPWLEARNPG